MGEDRGLIPTPPTIGSEYQRWSAVFAGDEYYYGSEPGPVARRAVRYHRQYRPRGGAALDAGCGEGQDLVFLADQGYVATGVEFTEAGVAKAERLLRYRGLEAELVCQDLHTYEAPRRFDLVLAVNSVQFLGTDGPACLRRLVAAVIPGGVFGISVFAQPETGAGRERAAARSSVGEGSSTADPCSSCGPVPHISQGLWLLTLEELLSYFAGWQMLEAARLWQWNPHTNQPQPFLTLVARNAPAPPSPFPLP